MLDIFLVQMESILSNDSDCRAKNFAKVRALLDASELQTAKENRLIVLPEMFATGYLPKNPEDFAETFHSNDFGNAPGEDCSQTAKFLQALAIEKNAIVFGTGIVRVQNKLFNHSGVFVPQTGSVGIDTQTSSGEVSGYNKIHPFFPELNRGFFAGDYVNLFKIGNWKIASAICYDLRFPELFRDAVKKGANLLILQAAWPKVRKAHWETLLRARAIENQMYIAAVNGVSPSESDPTKQLAGTSLILDPQGNMISAGNDSEEQVIRGQVSLEPLIQYRKDFPVLQGIVPQDVS